MKSQLFIALVAAMMLTVAGGHASAPEGCFPYPVALLKSKTLIYEQPDLSVVPKHHGNAEQPFSVLDSKLFGEDCWLQVRVEWKHEPPWRFMLADNATNGCVWHIDDEDPEFEAAINEGLVFLQEVDQSWHDYVTEHDYTIKPAADGARGSEADWPACTVEIYRPALKPEVVLATHLVHEACHIHQYVALRVPYEHETYARVRNEMECYGRELDMLQEIDLEEADEQALVEELMQKLENDFQQSYWWWAKCRLHTPATDIPTDEMEGLTC